MSWWGEGEETIRRDTSRNRGGGVAAGESLGGVPGPGAPRVSLEPTHRVGGGDGSGAQGPRKLGGAQASADAEYGGGTSESELRRQAVLSHRRDVSQGWTVSLNHRQGCKSSAMAGVPREAWAPLKQDSLIHHQVRLGTAPMVAGLAPARESTGAPPEKSSLEPRAMAEPRGGGRRRACHSQGVKHVARESCADRAPRAKARGNLDEER